MNRAGPVADDEIDQGPFGDEEHDRHHPEDHVVQMIDLFTDGGDVLRQPHSVGKSNTDGNEQPQAQAKKDCRLFHEAENVNVTSLVSDAPTVTL